MGKYWWEEEEDQKKQQSTQSTSQTSQSTEQKKGYWWDDESTVSTAANQITDRVNTWLQNHNNYISNYKNRYSNRKYNYEDDYVKDSADWLDTVSKQKSNFDAEADNILSYMDRYKNYLNPEWMDSVRNILTDARKDQGSIIEGVSKDNEWWNSFGSEELVKQYGSAEEAYKYYQRDDGYRKKYEGKSHNYLQTALQTMGDGDEKEWLSSYAPSVLYDERSKADLDAMAKEIEDMENLYNDAFTVGHWYNEYALGFTPYDSKRMNTYNRLKDEYGGDIYNLEEAISKKKREMTLASRVQEGIKLSGVGDETSEYYDPEFKQYTGYTGSTWIDGGFDRFFSWDDSAGMKTGYEDIRYDYINDPDAVTKVLSKSANDADLHLLSGLQPYQHMTEDQVATYNYYYAKHGKEAAGHYLDSIQDSLNATQGQQMAQRIEDKWLLQQLSGIGAGLDQAHSGLKNVFSNADYIPTSATQYASGYVRENLGENGGAFSQGLYDLITTTANMAPSILLSTAIGTLNPTVGAAVGNAMMGASAAGNAYSDAINRGFGKKEARTYSTLIGASEVALGSLLGGISKLGGVSSKLANAVAGIDKAFLRFSLQYGGKIASESLEEGLQEILDPLLQNAIMYADEDVNWNEVAYSALLGGLSAGLLEGVGTVAQVAQTEAALNKQAVKEYGGMTDAIIQEGLESDQKSKSYKLAQKYQKQVEGQNGKAGKAMTGAQIRKLLAANQDQVTPKDMKLIQQAAEKRLTELGQTDDVSKLAEIATRYATGGKVSKEEKSFLANSKYGSRVYNELLPKNIESGDYTSEWTEDIGTREVNVAQYGKKRLQAQIRAALDFMANPEDPNAYKSLEKRVGTESKLSVSESGKATIRESGKEVDLKQAEVVNFVQDKNTGKITDMTMMVDGEEVRASGIDYTDSSESYLFDAVQKIENITPGAATVAVRGYDPASGQTVSEYLNGFDEGFNYGYHNYSEADLKSGEFAPKLSQEQMMSAYRLGQSARNISDVAADAPVVKMRTEADAKLSAEQKLAKQKAQIESDDVEVYFEDGGTVIKLDEHTGKYDKKRNAAVNTAKFLSKLGIGGKYYFFESYLSKTLKDAEGNRLRVYKDANGNEVEAPNGIYKETDGSIHIDLNAGDYGQGTALFTLGHELTHFVKAQSKKQFAILSDLVKEAFDKTDTSMHERVLAKQKFLSDKRGEVVSYTEAHEEVVADAMSTMLTDGSFHEKLMEIKVKDKGLFNTIKRFFEKMIAKFRKEYDDLTPDQQDAQDIRQLKDMFDKIQNAFVEALVESSENFHASMESVVESNAEAVSANEIVTDGAVVTDGNGERFSIRSMKHDIAEGKMFEDLKTHCNWTDAQVKELRTQLKALVEYMIPYRDILDMNESYGAEGRRFSPYKPNSDPLYKISMDFSTLCSKRLLTQYVIENLQLRENRPMSAEEQMAIRAMLNEYRKVEKGMQVACAMCYVEAARLKSPKQIQRWLDDPEPHLRNYFALKNAEFNASVKEAQANFKESKGYDRNAPKKDMKPADVTELNKIGPKLRSQYQLSATEQAIVDKAKSLPNSTYLTAGNLATLSETDPAIYAAYTSFVRTATRSKSLETDEPYYYGDSTRDNGNGIIVSDSFIEAVNRENGMRFSSWSDWRIQHLLDYITAVIDNSVRGAAMHGYTKFGDEVRVLGKTGMMFNMSGVTGSQTGLNKDGSLNFSDTESIDVNEAIQLREEFPEHAGLQCIGVGNEHIIALLRSDIIDYVIPYHVSGLNAALRRMADIHGWKDYTGTQNASIDKSTKFENAVDQEHWHEEPSFSEFFVGYDTGMSGIDAMRASAERYKQLCKDRGLTPKFNQFANEDNYWKLLIDRKMINQQTGNLIRQKAVTPTFDFDVIKGVVDKFVDNYDAGLESRALNHIVENWDTIPQRIKDLKKGSKTKKSVDTLANETVAAQPKEKRSDRKSSVEKQDGNRYSSRYEKRFFPGNVFPTGLTHTAVTNWANRKDIKTGDKRLVYYRGAYYRVEKFDDMDFRYLITKKYDAQDYEEELREYGKIDGEESYESEFDQGLTRYREAAEHGQRGHHADSSRNEYGGENRSVYGVDSFEDQQWRADSQTERDRQGGLRDQRQTGRNPRLEYTPQELYDKMLELDEKLVFADGRYATKLKNQRERYASMIDEMNGWDRVRYSERGNGTSNRHLLANAFEGITNGSEEYKLIQRYKGYIAELNSLENKLSEFNRQIREISFGKGKYDAEKLEKLEKLETEAKKIADAINKYDQYLLSLEASEPLRKVIERERKKEAQKTKEHVKEIQQNKKLRAEQTELRHKIRKTIRDLDKILNRGNKKLNVKEDMQNVVSTALKAADILFTDNYDNFDMLRNGLGVDLSDSEEALVNECTRMLKDIDKMPTDGYDSWQARQEAENKLKAKMSKLKEVFARERKRLNNTKVSSILGELADAYSKLQDSEYSYVQGAYIEPVYTFLKNLQTEVGGTIVIDMTKDQLESLYAAYKMVLTTVRKANQMFNAELKMTREQLGNAVIEEVLKAGGVHLLGTKTGDAISQASWNNTKPVWVANRIGSDTFGKLMNGLFKGQYNFAVDVDEAKQFKLSMDEKYHPRNWDAEKLYKFESSTGKEFSLNLQQIMSLYAFSKREQAYSHLLNGGFVFEDNSTVVVDGKLGIKKTYIHKGATSYKLNEATLNGIINSLTAEQKAYVDEMQKYLSEVMGAKGNEVSMQLYGIQMFKEQFYFPLRSSGAYMEKAKEAEMKKQQGQINLVNSGFTHAVKPEARNPIILSGFMDVWAEHCNEMSMYHSMVLPMEDFRKVYNYTTVHDENMDSASVFQTIQDAYGKAATNYIDQLYRELNAGATIDPRETPYKKLISNFKKAAVMLSGSVVVQQFSSIGRAYAVIDPKHFVGAKVNSNTNLSAAEEMKKYAPVAIIKEMGGFDTGTKGSAKNYIMAEKYGKGERIKGFMKDEQYRGDIMGIAPAKADEMTWSVIWEAAKRETKAMHPNMDVKSEEFLKLAGERFSEVIEKTQVYDSVLARSANMRSKTGLMQMATAFMAEPTTTINLLEDALRGRSVKKIARAFGSVAASIVLNNALASIVYAMRDDDDDETFLEKYGQSFFSGLIDDVNPMTYYPFLKDIYSLFQGYDVERADMSVIADLRDALKKAITLIGKDTAEMDDDELAEHWKNVNGVLMGVLDAGCSALGVPVKNVRRDVNGIINAFNTIKTDVTERDTTWNSFWDKVGAAAKDTVPIYAFTNDRTKKDKLYDTIVSGDKEYLGRIKSTYKTEDSYHSAVRSTLRENDPRIKEAAQAHINGNPSERVRIAKQIIADGFEQDDVVMAINAEINAMTPDDDTGTKKAKGFYTVEDFVREIANGDQATANAVREDVIQTAQKNGKTAEAAEKSFASSVKSEAKKSYLDGVLNDSQAEKILLAVGESEEDVAPLVSYWEFCKKHPQYDFNQSNVEKYLEFAEPAGISVDVFVQYINGTKGLATIYDEWGDVELSKRDQVLEVIDSLDLTWEQKDALYLAAGYAESEIWDVPW